MLKKTLFYICVAVAYVAVLSVFLLGTMVITRDCTSSHKDGYRLTCTKPQ